jgi:hypothetical protein
MLGKKNLPFFFCLLTSFLFALAMTRVSFLSCLSSSSLRGSAKNK